MARKKKLTKVQKEWIAALRSGKYRQAEETLREKRKFCCLGVACDLYGKVNGIKWKSSENTDLWTFLNDRTELPPEVRNSLKLRSPNGHFKSGSIEFEEHDVTYSCLVDMNDDSWTFKEIADFIEANPEEVFK